MNDYGLMLKALKIITDFADKTLILDQTRGIDYCRGYSEGAHAAFAELAAIAALALEGQVQP